MGNWWKVRENSENLDHLVQAVEYHDKTCKTCTESDQCVLIGTLYEEVEEIITILAKTVHNGIS
jgi:hypothetical protein